MHVSVDDPLRHIVSTSSSAIEQESLLSNEKDALHTLDLSKLNLDDLLLLLYRLQQRTTKTPVTTSNSTISSSSSSSSSSSDCIGSYSFNHLFHFHLYI
jgi:thiazolylpeptide-type bacteriocin precursor